MANAEKRRDNALKAAKPGAKSARRRAGPKYLRNASEATPTVGKVAFFGKKS
jgi:hypothetical protein